MATVKPDLVGDIKELDINGLEEMEENPSATWFFNSHNEQSTQSPKSSDIPQEPLKEPLEENQERQERWLKPSSPNTPLLIPPHNLSTTTSSKHHTSSIVNQISKYLKTQILMTDVRCINVRETMGCSWTEWMVVSSLPHTQQQQNDGDIDSDIEDDDGDQRAMLNSISTRVFSDLCHALSNTNNSKDNPNNKNKMDKMDKEMHMERDDESGWHLIDAGWVVIHLMTPRARRVYGVDELWSCPINNTSSAK